SEVFKVSSHYQTKVLFRFRGSDKAEFFLQKMLSYRAKGTCLPQSAVITFINLSVDMVYLQIEEYYISERGYQDAWDDGCDR
ncbi:hypothetical protein BIW75_15725, partial [Salmonella enterica]|nr:hypothetical protein [Salmonella enterica]